MQKPTPPPPNEVVDGIERIELPADPGPASKQYFSLDIETWLTIIHLSEVESRTAHQRRHSWTLRHAVGWICHGAQPEIDLPLLQ